MSDYYMQKLCKFYLDDSHTDCCCSVVYHNLFKFGEDAIHNKSIRYVDISPDEGIEVSPDEQEIYNEKYNKYTGEVCLCCDAKLLELNTHRCSECGCFLCVNCTIRGRYGRSACFDEDIEEYCYNCRRFGFEKNCLFWNTFHYREHTFFSIAEYEIIYTAGLLYEDWLKASYYY